MKKCAFVLGLIIALPAFAAKDSGYNVSRSEGYYTTRPAQPTSNRKINSSRKNGGYTNTIQNNFYSSGQPARASSYDVKTSRQGYQRPTYSSARYDYDYDDSYGKSSVVRERQVRTVNKSYSTQERKFFLAHPFFQPLKGKFGSVTDFSYATNNFKFDILDASVQTLNPNYNLGYGALNPVLSGKVESTQMAIKEDFSFGLSDTLAVIGMLQYDRTEVSLKDWSNGDSGNKTKDSGLNIFGIGLQSRFVDNADWIAMVSGYYQHQRNVANTFIGELKVGYKIDRTTLYGLGRAGYSNLTKGDIYGAYVEENGDYMMLSYNTDVDDIIYVEGGVGAFAVLNKYFTLNGELIYGYYDWHEQLNIKGAIGWQPGDMFALNLYAATSLYDSADGKTKKYMNYDGYPSDMILTDSETGEVLSTESTAWYTTGDYKIKDYREWKIGVQAILYF